MKAQQESFLEEGVRQGLENEEKWEEEVTLGGSGLGEAMQPE